MRRELNNKLVVFILPIKETKERVPKTILLTIAGRKKVEKDNMSISDITAIIIK